MTCPHGEIHPAACMDCVADPPEVVPPGPEQKLDAERWITASHSSPCARDEDHWVTRGQWIGHVPGVGWCCKACAR